MATYKVIQDIEAEDKLVGPLTLRQFIYAGIAAISIYLGFLSATKGAAFMLVIFVPVAGATGFFAFPWGKDQPTEIWALARLRFLLKPRRRIWDQSGAKELVTITVPKTVERQLTNGLNQAEVRSRLNALASTIDSRGWAVKNVNLSMGGGALPVADTSDRLVNPAALPQAVSDIDIQASDDMLDETANPVAHNFDTMINAATAAHRQQLMTQLQQASATVAPGSQPQTPADYWFMHSTPSAAPGQATFVDASVITPGAPAQPAGVLQAATPTAEEEALAEQLKARNETMSAAYGNMKVLKTPEELAAEAAARQKAAAAVQPPVTPDNQAAIIDLARNNDLNIATIQRQANKQADDGEVVISLH
jgi:hypothetical protein